MKFTALVLCYYLFLGTSFDVEAKRIDPIRIRIDVINEDTASNLCVRCWSTPGQGKHKQQKCFPADDPVGSISWDFQPNFKTTFWCFARWGLTKVKQFPVFGEGVPRVSSSWLIDGRGKRRFMENERFVNDFFEDWPGLSLTTKKEDWLSTTEEEPITEEPFEPTESTTEEWITSEAPPSTTTEEDRWTTTEEVPITEEPITTTEDNSETTTEQQTTTEEQTTEISTTEDATTEWLSTTEDSTTDDPTTTEDSTTDDPTSTVDPGEGFVCPVPAGNFPDPLDCTAYYACDDGVVVGHQHCPDGLYFNPAINNCDYPWNVDCPLRT